MAGHNPQSNNYPQLLRRVIAQQLRTWNPARPQPQVKWSKSGSRNEWTTVNTDLSKILVKAQQRRSWRKSAL